MRLKRAIYGLKQAALAWWRALDKSMAALGVTVSGLVRYAVMTWDLGVHVTNITTFIPFTDQTPTRPIADPEGGRSPNLPNERRTGSQTS